MIQDRNVAIVLIAVAMLVGGCANTGKTVEGTSEPLSLATIETADYAVDYQRLSDCAFGKLETVGLRKVDLLASKTVKVARDNGGVRFWELSFIAVAPGRTRVDVAVVRGTWGNASPGVAREPMAAVRACASEGHRPAPSE